MAEVEQIEECRRLIKLVDELLHDSDPDGEAHGQIHELAHEFAKLHPRGAAARVGG